MRDPYLQAESREKIKTNSKDNNAPTTVSEEIEGIKKYGYVYSRGNERNIKFDLSRENISTFGADGNAQKVKPVFYFPTKMHWWKSFCNLVTIIGCKGPLISKATGGEFYASDELISLLWQLKKTDDAIRTLSEAGPDTLKGIKITESRILFTGFPATDSIDEINAWRILASALNYRATKRKVVYKNCTVINEKYSFRATVIKNLIDKDSMALHRQTLCKRLSGNVCFRTKESAIEWTKKHAPLTYQRWMKDADSVPWINSLPNKND